MCDSLRVLIRSLKCVAILIISVCFCLGSDFSMLIIFVGLLVVALVPL